MLVLRPGALGDTLLAVPALRALRGEHRPLRLAAHAGAARLLAELGEVDEGLAFDDPTLVWIFGGEPPDEEVVAWMRPTAGLARAAIVAPSRPSDPEHVARYLLRTLAPLNVDQTFDDQPFQVTPIVSDDILIHTGSGSPTKNWAAARFAEVIRQLDTSVRLIVGEADTAVFGHTYPVLEGLSLKELAQRLAGCRAYLGNDSGVSHLAGLCGAHTVAMFGPTDPALWRPIGPDVTVLPFAADALDVARALLG